MKQNTKKLVPYKETKTQTYLDKLCLSCVFKFDTNIKSKHYIHKMEILIY